MHLCRTRYFRALGQKYFLDLLVPFAATQIQRIVRGRMGRRRHALMFDVVLVARIDNPAAKRLQRIYRGYRGRIKATVRPAWSLVSRDKCSYYFDDTDIIHCWCLSFKNWG